MGWPERFETLSVRHRAAVLAVALLPRSTAEATLAELSAWGDLTQIWNALAAADDAELAERVTGELAELLREDRATLSRVDRVRLEALLKGEPAGVRACAREALGMETVDPAHPRPRSAAAVECIRRRLARVAVEGGL